MLVVGRYSWSGFRCPVFCFDRLPVFVVVIVEVDDHLVIQVGKGTLSGRLSAWRCTCWCDHGIRFQN
jgi:hypothetical protein